MSINPDRIAGRNKLFMCVCSEGKLLGYTAFLSEERYPDSAASLTDATIGFLSMDKLLKLLE